MLNRDTIIDIRKIIASTGPFQSETLSDEKKVFAVQKDAGSEEKYKAESTGRSNIVRYDINEEEFDNETILIDGNTKVIYKTAKVKNKVLLYCSDEKTGGD